MNRRVFLRRLSRQTSIQDAKNSNNNRRLIRCRLLRADSDAWLIREGGVTGLGFTFIFSFFSQHTRNSHLQLLCLFPSVVSWQLILFLGGLLATDPVPLGLLATDLVPLVAWQLILFLCGLLATGFCSSVVSWQLDSVPLWSPGNWSCSAMVSWQLILFPLVSWQLTCFSVVSWQLDPIPLWFSGNRFLFCYGLLTTGEVSSLVLLSSAYCSSHF